MQVLKPILSSLSLYLTFQERDYFSDNVSQIFSSILTGVSTSQSLVGNFVMVSDIVKPEKPAVNNGSTNFKTFFC